MGKRIMFLICLQIKYITLIKKNLRRMMLYYAKRKITPNWQGHGKDLISK